MLRNPLLPFACSTWATVHCPNECATQVANKFINYSLQAITNWWFPRNIHYSLRTDWLHSLQWLFDRSYRWWWSHSQVTLLCICSLVCWLIGVDGTHTHNSHMEQLPRFTVPSTECISICTLQASTNWPYTIDCSVGPKVWTCRCLV